MHPWDEEYWLPGALSKNQMKSLHRKEYLIGVENFDSAADFSSIDLHLSDQDYRLKHGSIKPCGEQYSNILGDPKHTEVLEPDENGHFKLDSKNCYVFKLKEVSPPTY